MNQLAFGSVFNEYYDGYDTWHAYNDVASMGGWDGIGVGAVRPVTDHHWEADRSRACVCDSGWTGVNCASRQCPHGNDSLDTRANTGVSAVQQVQTITLLSGGPYIYAINATSKAGQADFVDKTFALTFTSQLGEKYTTIPVALTATNGHSAMAGRIQSALLDLPNKVIDGVTVTANAFTNPSSTEDWAGMKVRVTFTGNSVHGTQHLLEVNADPCGAGCTPRIDGLVTLMTGGTNITSSVKQTTAADFNSYECGRRGKCDFETGICSCFEGFTGEACSTPTALV